MSNWVHEGTEKLEQIRDELKLKIHLGRADAKDLWAGLEGKWSEVKKRQHEIEQAGAESAADLKAAADLLMDEIAEGYDKIRKAL